MSPPAKRARTSTSRTESGSRRQEGAISYTQRQPYTQHRYTEAEISEIEFWAAQGTMPNLKTRRDMATRFGVSNDSVRNLLKRRLGSNRSTQPDSAPVVRPTINQASTSAKPISIRPDVSAPDATLKFCPYVADAKDNLRGVQNDMWENQCSNDLQSTQETVTQLMSYLENCPTENIVDPETLLQATKEIKKGKEKICDEVKKYLTEVNTLRDTLGISQIDTPDHSISDTNVMTTRWLVLNQDIKDEIADANTIETESGPTHPYPEDIKDENKDGGVDQEHNDKLE